MGVLAQRSPCLSRFLISYLNTLFSTPYVARAPVVTTTLLLVAFILPSLYIQKQVLLHIKCFLHPVSTNHSIGSHTHKAHHCAPSFRFRIKQVQLLCWKNNRHPFWTNLYLFILLILLILALLPGALSFQPPIAPQPSVE